MTPQASKGTAVVSHDQPMVMQMLAGSAPVASTNPVYVWPTSSQQAVT